MDLMQTTLCFFIKNNQILLGRKKRGFGAGKYNGFGGKLEEGEQEEEAMIRECKEEVGLTPTEYEKVGYIEFDEYLKGKRGRVAFHLYVATSWEGEETESEEMCPEWFDISKIPYDNMFPDDIYWLPIILKGEKINAFFQFDQEWKILSKKIEKL